MFHQCGITEVCFSDISSPKRGSWDKYSKILELIKDEFKFKFTPKSELDNAMLLLSAKKFEK
jgi:hypothetical protein